MKKNEKCFSCKEVATNKKSNLHLRVGKILINEILFSSERINENELVEIFSNFFPFSTQELKENHAIKFLGVSPYFRKLKDGEPIPEYKIHLISKNKKCYFDFMEEVIYFTGEENQFKEEKSISCEGSYKQF
jgi:hypothetical protein